MRNIKLNDREYPISVTGETIVIFVDELKKDIFRTMNLLLTTVGKGQIPAMDVIASMIYAGIKTANPEMFKSYNAFMKSITRLDGFLNVETLDILMQEYNEAFGFNETNDALEGEQTSKKNQIQ